ncbi:MAG: hypothetical protein H7A23_01425 [Leptospiraceae bacterium]|nr:hypothetical protein [Leptospiraceae bacterium]
MQFEFSNAASMKDFSNPDTKNKVYFGFASSPTNNIFSQKYPGSGFGSTTRFFLENSNQLQIKNFESVTLVLHIVKDTVTLDVATAAFLSTLSTEQLKIGKWKYIANYIERIEKGISKPPFERSLYAFYYATAMVARDIFPKNDQVERNNYLISNYWKLLNHIMGLDQTLDYELPYNVMDLVKDRELIRVQEEMILNDKERYFNDVKRAESFELELPRKQTDSGSHASHIRVNLLALIEPKSQFFKFFARNPLTYESGETMSFPLTYVHEPTRKGKMSEHVLSVPPDSDFNLQGFADLIEEMEDYARKQKGVESRLTDNPREGYYYNDPWYDERHITPGRSIIDTPKAGSLLSRDDILEALWFYGNPLKNIFLKYVTSSVFIPLWKVPFNSEDANWKRIYLKNKFGTTFLPYVGDIFSDHSESVASYEYTQPVKLNLSPIFDRFEEKDFIKDEKIGIHISRKNSLSRCQEQLNNASIKVFYHRYENNFGLIEIEADFNFEKIQGNTISITDSQWLEHCISLTPFDTLCENISGFNIEQLQKGLLFPERHFIITTLTDFECKGGLLTDGRSTGGGIQMLVNDAEPAFSNLPMNKNLETEQTIVDEITKRHYYVSATSLLNFDDSASYSEHYQAHQTSRTLFNMTLAQRFILSQSRAEIVRAESNYKQRKKMNFGQWVSSWFKTRKGKEEIFISQLREDILHLVTSSWFGVVSSNRYIQKIFEVLRQEMKIDHLYEEVKDRCTDMDEFISNKQSETQNRVFNIFTFILSPLNLVMGFAAGFQFSKFEHPFPFSNYSPEGWIVFWIYFIFFSVIFGFVWLVYEWLNLKE